ncbi:ABC transporter ATP-binding protein [Candidatus Woesearchaeota archaeon]|nr:ABC transporter ATP-binding protein [Candidatus Woesearchaeota archaeon]
MSEIIITLKGITKKFGEKTVLDNIDLDIRKGEILGIAGVNGSGKTTLLRILVGFYKQDKGQLYFGTTPFSRVPDMKKKIGIATQDNCFYPRLTVEENIDYFGRIYGMTNAQIKASINDTLKLVNLYDVRKMLAKNLSGGMQKRVGIACSIIHSPQVIILDEPTSELDFFLKKDMIKLIKLINEQGITILIASHHLSELESLCDRIAILEDGKLVELGSPSELKHIYSSHTLEGVFEKLVKRSVS